MAVVVATTAEQTSKYIIVIFFTNYQKYQFIMF